MIIYPALDLRGGKVVRLRSGDPNQQVVYGDDPLVVADRWIAAGAEWLHVINLDGAFADPNAEQNERMLELLADTGLPIQFGGGLRTFEDVQRAFDLGATRVILGTMAVENPDHVAAAIARWGTPHVAVALDAREGIVATHGWQHESGVNAVDLGLHMASLGAEFALYTDVSRDGQLSGVNIEATVELAQATGLKVIASGGVTTLSDITELRDSGVVEGAVLGTALYEGVIDLAEAIRLARG